MGQLGIAPAFASFGEFIALATGFLAFVLIMTTAFTVALILLVRAGVRRVRQDRRIGKATLMVQLHGTQPGPRRTLAQCRLRLHEAVTGARSAVTVLHANGGLRGQLGSLTRRFDQAAGAFDAQLRLMQSEPYEEILRSTLGPIEARLSEFEGIARQIRHTAFALLGGELDATVGDLAAEVEREMRALQAGIDALRALRVSEVGMVGAFQAGSTAGAPVRTVAKEHSI